MRGAVDDVGARNAIDGLVGGICNNDLAALVAVDEQRDDPAGLVGVSVS